MCRLFLGQNVFIFMQFSRKIGRIVCWCPPFGVGTPASGKSLDLPLNNLGPPVVQAERSVKKPSLLFHPSFYNHRNDILSHNLDTIGGVMEQLQVEIFSLWFHPFHHFKVISD